MKSFKLIISIILASVLALCAVGCTAKPALPSSGTDTTKAPQESSTEVPTAEPTEAPATEDPNAVTFSFKHQDTGVSYVFRASVPLPEGWELRAEQPEQGFPYFNGVLFDLKYVYDTNGACIGAVGANVITLENLGDASAFEDPNAVYCMINSGSGFRVDTHEVYDPVTTENGCRNAISEAYYSAEFLRAKGIEDAAEVFDPVILSENTDTHCYIAIEFAEGALSAQDLRDLAAFVTVYAG